MTDFRRECSLPFPSHTERSSLSSQRSFGFSAFSHISSSSSLLRHWHSRVARVLELCHLWIKNNYTVAAIINLCAFFMITDLRARKREDRVFFSRYEIESTRHRRANVKWGKELMVVIFAFWQLFIQHLSNITRKAAKLHCNLDSSPCCVMGMCNNFVWDAQLSRLHWCPEGRRHWKTHQNSMSHWKKELT